MVTGLRDAAKIEVVDPELKKAMDAAASKGETAVRAICRTIRQGRPTATIDAFGMDRAR